MVKNNKNINYFINLLINLYNNTSKKTKISKIFFKNIYLKAVLEFRGDARPNSFQANNYNLYSYGGMKFLLISSSIFLLVSLI
jgi:hypothetical protein